MAPPSNHASHFNDRLKNLFGTSVFYCEQLDLLSGAVSQVQDELKLIAETLQDFRTLLGGFDSVGQQESPRAEPEC